MANISAGTKLTPSTFNDLLTRLNTVRANHLNKDGQNSTANSTFRTAFTTSVAASGAKVAAANVQKLRDTLTTLSQSAWLDTTFASRVTVPSAGTLVRASDFNIWDNTVTAVERVCANYSAYRQYRNYNQYGQYGAYDAYGHYDYTQYRNYYQYSNYNQNSN